MLICTDQSKQRTRDEHKISVSCTTKYFLMLMDLKKDTFASPIVSTASQDTIMKGVASTKIPTLSRVLGPYGFVPSPRITGF